MSDNKEINLDDYPLAGKLTEWVQDETTNLGMAARDNTLYGYEIEEFEKQLEMYAEEFKSSQFPEEVQNDAWRAVLFYPKQKAWIQLCIKQREDYITKVSENKAAGTAIINNGIVTAITYLMIAYAAALVAGVTLLADMDDASRWVPILATAVRLLSYGFVVGIVGVGFWLYGGTKALEEFDVIIEMGAGGHPDGYKAGHTNYFIKQAPIVLVLSTLVFAYATGFIGKAADPMFDYKNHWAFGWMTNQDMSQLSNSTNSTGGTTDHAASSARCDDR